MIRLEMSEIDPARRRRQPSRRVGYGLLQQNRLGYCERIVRNSGAGQQLFKADAVAGPWPVLWSVCLGQYGNDGQRFFVNGIALQVYSFARGVFNSSARLIAMDAVSDIDRCHARHQRRWWRNLGLGLRRLSRLVSFTGGVAQGWSGLLLRRSAGQV